MNEKIVEELLKYMNETKDFVLQETPEIISQIITYEKYLCVFSLFVFFPLFFISLGILIYHWVNPQYETYGSMAMKTMFPIIASIGLLFISFGVCLDASTGLIKINTAPKYFIIQKILKLKDGK